MNADCVVARLVPASRGSIRKIAVGVGSNACGLSLSRYFAVGVGHGEPIADTASTAIVNITNRLNFIMIEVKKLSSCCARSTIARSASVQAVFAFKDLELCRSGLLESFNLEARA
jgi:hypothetical protein